MSLARAWTQATQSRDEHTNHESTYVFLKSHDVFDSKQRQNMKIYLSLAHELKIRVTITSCKRMWRSVTNNNFMWKVNWSTWHKHGAKKKTLSPSWPPEHRAASCWSIHLSHFVTELKIYHLYILKITHNYFGSAGFKCSSMQNACHIWTQLMTLLFVSFHSSVDRSIHLLHSVTKPKIYHLFYSWLLTITLLSAQWP